MNRDTKLGRPVMGPAYRIVSVAVAFLLTGGVVTIARLRSHAVVAVSCRSPALGGRLPALVYLPTGYGHGSTRYPVIYFLHGLPAGPSSYTANGFVAAAVARGSRRAIVVAPQGARTPNSDREYLDWGPKENWPLAIAGDLPRCIDARFRTIAERGGRALIGLSAGGFGAFNIGLRNVATFRAIESWGGYFEATDPTGLHQLQFGSHRRNAMARVPRGAGLKAAVTKLPTFVGFYVGRQDDRFRNDNVAFDRALTRAHIRHLFRMYPGGHTYALWESLASVWLRYALAPLAVPR